MIEKISLYNLYVVFDNFVLIEWNNNCDYSKIWLFNRVNFLELFDLFRL